MASWPESNSSKMGRAMEARIEKLEEQVVLAEKVREAMRKDYLTMMDFINQMAAWFGNVVTTLEDKGVFSKADIEALMDIEKQREQFRKDASLDLLFHLSGEEGTPPQ